MASACQWLWLPRQWLRLRVASGFGLRVANGFGLRARVSPFGFDLRVATGFGFRGCGPPIGFDLRVVIGFGLRVRGAPAASAFGWSMALACGPPVASACGWQWLGLLVHYVRNCIGLLTFPMMEAGVRACSSPMASACGHALSCALNVGQCASCIRAS